MKVRVAMETAMEIAAVDTPEAYRRAATVMAEALGGGHLVEIVEQFMFGDLTDDEFAAAAESFRAALEGRIQ